MWAQGEAPQHTTCLLLGASASSRLTCSVHLSQQARLCAAETSLSGWTPLWASPRDSNAVPVLRMWRSPLPAQIQHQISETYCFLCVSPWGSYELLRVTNRNLKSALPDQPAAPPGIPVSGPTVYPCTCLHSQKLGVILTPANVSISLLLPPLVPACLLDSGLDLVPPPSPTPVPGHTAATVSFGTRMFLCSPPPQGEANLLAVGPVAFCDLTSFVSPELASRHAPVQWTLRSIPMSLQVLKPSPLCLTSCPHVHFLKLEILSFTLPFQPCTPESPRSFL